MAHSLEARVPFLDYRLVQACFSVRAEQLLDGGVTKVLLRRALGAAAVVVALVVAVRLVDGVGGAAEVALKLGICLAYLPLLAALRVVGSRELHALGTLRSGGLRRRAASALDPAPAAGPGTSGPTAPD